MACNCNYLLFLSGYWLWKLMNSFYYCDCVTITHLILLYHDWFGVSCLTLSMPWTGALRAPLSRGFSRQEYWSGLPFPSPRDLPDPRVEPRSPALQRFFTNWSTDPTQCIMIGQQKNYRILLSPKVPFNRKTCNHFIKFRCISELSSNFWKIQMPRYCFFPSRAPDMFLMGSHI